MVGVDGWEVATADLVDLGVVGIGWVAPLLMDVDRGRAFEGGEGGGDDDGGAFAVSRSSALLSCSNSAIRSRFCPSSTSGVLLHLLMLNGSDR